MKKSFYHFLLILVLAAFLACTKQDTIPNSATEKIEQSSLFDKIKSEWNGTIVSSDLDKSQRFYLKIKDGKILEINTAKQKI